MKLTYVLMLLSILFLLPSCAPKTQYVVRTETAKVYVSEQDKHPTQVPIKAVEPLTITDALRRGREMRGQFCNLYSEYIEMLRNATYGEIILDRSTEDRCPTSE